MKACLQTMAEAELLPQGLLLINSGVRLAVEGAPVLAQLQALAAKGVDIQACGTCLDYFNLKDKLAVGGITNMYTILSQMSGANKAVTL
jgi:selenium metabolism protein YedF